jgi:hypothetical protein
VKLLQIIILLLVLLLTACSQPDATGPLSTAPVSTASPELEQPEIIMPATNIGTPLPGWEAIPIMPGAYDPELADMVYLYTVDTPIGQVEEYYQGKMNANGWTLMSREELDAGPTGGPSTVLDYQKNEKLLNIMLVNLAEKNATAVILSQLGP